MSRTLALTGLAGIALLDVAWFWDPTPPIDWSNGHLDAYFATHSNAHWLIAAVLQFLAVPFLWVFARAVRDRLASAGAPARTVRAAGEAGRAFAVTVLAFSACYAVIPFTEVFTDVGVPEAQIYRFWNAGTFALYIPASTVCVALLVGAVSVAAFRRQGIPLGLGVAGVPLGLLVLATFFLPMAGITLWFLAASITLAASRPRQVRAAAPQPVAATL